MKTNEDRSSEENRGDREVDEKQSSNWRDAEGLTGPGGVNSRSASLDELKDKGKNTRATRVLYPEKNDRKERGDISVD